MAWSLAFRATTVHNAALPLEALFVIFIVNVKNVIFRVSRQPLPVVRGICCVDLFWGVVCFAGLHNAKYPSQAQQTSCRVS